MSPISVRKKTAETRRTLYRTCFICGQAMVTQADTPWVRQMYFKDGEKKQVTCYFCSQTCKRASYSHPGYWDGKAEERRLEREQNRDVREKNRRYYEKHKDSICAKKREDYAKDPEKYRERNRYNKQKRKLLTEESAVS